MDEALAPFRAALRALCPGFREDAAPPLRSLKCLLLRGAIDGAPVIAKHLARDEPPWRWYFTREIALYERFASAPPPVRTPRLIAADPLHGVLVLERISGTALASGRCATTLDASAADAVLAACDALGAWVDGAALAPSASPDPASRREIRARLLEDPTAPLTWHREGFARCAALGILTEADAARMDQALCAAPAIAFAHGDLLLRNVARDGHHGVALLDWECAGTHPRDWDRALLWAGLPDERRAQVEAAVQRDGGVARWAAFLAGVAFALARELKFRRFPARNTARDEVVARRIRELDGVLAALRGRT